jgi:hypothetical protein
MNTTQQTMAMIGSQLFAAQTTHVMLIKWAKAQAEIILDVQKETGVNLCCRDGINVLPERWIFTSVVDTQKRFYDDDNPYHIYCDGYKNIDSTSVAFPDMTFAMGFVLHPLIVAGNTVGYEKFFRAELIEYAGRNLR